MLQSENCYNSLKALAPLWSCGRKCTVEGRGFCYNGNELSITIASNVIMGNIVDFRCFSLSTPVELLNGLIKARMAIQTLY